MKKNAFKKTLMLCVFIFVVLFTFNSCAKKPGTLIDPKDLPKADRLDIGSTVAVSMETLLQELPEGEKTVTFAYVYNGTEQTGRLVAITYYEYEKPAAILTVYEPEWSGIEGLLSAIEGTFPAKIVDRAIISAEENRRLLMNSYRVSYDAVLKDAEIISPSNGMQPAGDGMHYYFGHISNQSNDSKCYKTQAGNYWMLVGSAENSASESVLSGITNLKATAKRFKLETSLGI